MITRASSAKSSACEPVGSLGSYHQSNTMLVKVTAEPVSAVKA